MRQDQIAVEGFYEECAALLNCDDAHCKRPEGYIKNRWCNRMPGSGRFIGFGIIRAWGETVHVALTNPVKINRSFGSRVAALEFLKGLPHED
jgi:hypothetical protein